MVALHYFDLDDFKAVNDSFGHLTGDRLLVAVAQRLRTCVRDSDTLARLGGDEFAIVQSGVTDRGGATLLAERMLAALTDPFSRRPRFSYQRERRDCPLPRSCRFARAAAPGGGSSALSGQGHRPGALRIWEPSHAAVLPRVASA